MRVAYNGACQTSAALLNTDAMNFVECQCAMTGERVPRTSESKDGTKRDAQVVVRAAVEVNRVAKLQPQPDWT
jgi:hypothetical protein